MPGKTELLESIRAFRRGVLAQLDEFESAVIAMEDAQTEQPVKVQQGNDGWMTVKEVCKALKISDATFYARVKDGTFPPGLAFSPKSKRWRLSDIIAWQDKSQHDAGGGRPKTTERRRGRVSRVRKIEEFAYV